MKSKNKTISRSQTPFALFTELASTLSVKHQNEHGGELHEVGPTGDRTQPQPPQKSEVSKTDALPGACARTAMRRDNRNGTCRVSKGRKRTSRTPGKARSQQVAAKGRGSKKTIGDKTSSHFDERMYAMDESPDSSEREVLQFAERARRAAEKKRKVSKASIRTAYLFEGNRVTTGSSASPNIVLTCCYTYWM